MVDTESICAQRKYDKYFQENIWKYLSYLYLGKDENTLFTYQNNTCFLGRHRYKLELCYKLKSPYQSNGVNLWYFKLRLFDLTELTVQNTSNS